MGEHFVFVRLSKTSDHFSLSLALLLLRLVMGAAFVLHGWPKIQNPLAWMGPEAPFPAALQLLAACAEFLGGIALILGLATRAAAFGIVAVMTGALSLVHLPQKHAFVAMPPQLSFELPALYLVCAIMLLLLGAGRFSFDAWWYGSRGKKRQH